MHYLITQEIILSKTHEHDLNNLKRFRRLHFSAFVNEMRLFKMSESNDFSECFNAYDTFSTHYFLYAI